MRIDLDRCTVIDAIENCIAVGDSWVVDWTDGVHGAAIG